MQKKDREAQLSRLRQALDRQLKELERVLEVICRRGALVKGNVYELARRCGKPSCACTRGQLHRSIVLSSSEEGKTRLRVLAPGEVAQIRPQSERYVQFRRARAQVSKIVQQMLALIDRIEQIRREAP